MLSITNLADVDAVLLSSSEPSVRCHAVLGLHLFGTRPLLPIWQVMQCSLTDVSHNMMMWRGS